MGCLATLLSERVFPEDAARLHQLFQDLAVGKKVRQEWRLRRNDGRAVEVDITIGQLADGRLTCFARDATERKENERSRRRLLESEREARSQAERLNRLKDEFLATLSHELRTPLHAISGWAQLLQTQALEAEDEQAAVETILRNCRSLSQMIEELLDTSKIVSGKLHLELVPLDLTSVVSQACQSIAPNAEARNIRLLMDVPKRSIIVNGDTTRLQQVVWNLLSNALRYSSEGGDIRVKLEKVGPQARLSVTDLGEGIEPDFLPFIFDRFRQADGSTTRRYGGMGLGLHLVRQLTELHGGTVSATSPGRGQGSTFELRLPICPAQTSEAATVLKGPNVELGGVRVLVVDDDRDAREIVSRVLGERGASVLALPSAEEALARITEFSPHLLVSDISMPEVDGYELLSRIRSGYASADALPALALSAFARESDRQKAAQVGFQTYLCKPLEVNQLVLECRRLLEEAQVERSEG